MCVGKFSNKWHGYYFKGRVVGSFAGLFFRKKIRGLFFKISSGTAGTVTQSLFI